MNYTQNFNKVFLLDTNIILDNPENIQVLSQGGSNLIILPTTVLDECDVKKSGFDEINFNAREFNRLMLEAELGETTEDSESVSLKFEYKDVKILTIDLKEYQAEKGNVALSILSDRKILETASKALKHFPNMIVVSNDVAFRTRALTKKIPCEPFKNNYRDVSKVDFQIKAEIDFNPPNIISAEALATKLNITIPSHTTSLVLTNSETGRQFIGVMIKGEVEFIDDSSKRLDPDFTQLARPQNIGQKVFSKLIMNPQTEVVVCNSQSGSGKTYVAASSACKLIDRDKNFTKIVYIRKTISSQDSQSELGFLKGALDEKLSPYIEPMESAIEGFVRAKHKTKKITKADVDAEVEEFKQKYPIEYPWAGHLRGTTITGAVILLDEVQNFSIADIVLLLSRVGNNCKVIVTGSIKQIDNPYLNRFNNGLTYLVDRCTKVNSTLNNGDVTVVGCELDVTVRSKISEWADNFLSTRA